MYQRDELSVQMPDVESRKDNVKVLCSVFVLNRHTNLAAGPPYCLTDSDVGFLCQYVFLIPVRSYTDSSIGGVFYLSALLSYVKLGLHAWTSIAAGKYLLVHAITKHHIDFFSRRFDANDMNGWEILPLQDPKSPHKRSYTSELTCSIFLCLSPSLSTRVAPKTPLWLAKPLRLLDTLSAR